MLPFVIAMQPLNALVSARHGIDMSTEDFGLLAAQIVTSAVTAGAVLRVVVPRGWSLQGARRGLPP